MQVRNGAVFVSTGKSIFANLALEDWLYKNLNFSRLNVSMLLMWRNEPSVVIGVHQNPWIECCVKKLEDNRVTLARRCSGGGTVYHDLGNLNCSFLTPRNKYNRKVNLNILCNALKRWDLDVTISPRDDLFLNDHKISGTASKLGKDNAYHHCTVLLDVNRSVLQEVLHKNGNGIISKATCSVKSPVINLRDVCPDLKMSDLINEIAHQYQEFHQVPTRSVHFTNADEEEFPGIRSITEYLRSWDYVFGKTPRLQVHRQYELPSASATNCVVPYMKVTVTVYHGVIEKTEIDLPVMRECIVELQTLLGGVRFCYEDVSTKLFIWVIQLDEKNKILGEFVKSCIVDLISDVYS